MKDALAAMKPTVQAFALPCSIAVGGLPPDVTVMFEWSPCKTMKRCESNEGEGDSEAKGPKDDAKIVAANIEMVEAMCKESKYIKNIFMHQVKEGLCVAVVEPVRDAAYEWGNVPEADRNSKALEKVCKNADFEEAVLEDISHLFMASGMSTKYDIDAVAIDHREWGMFDPDKPTMTTAEMIKNAAADAMEVTDVDGEGKEKDPKLVEILEEDEDDEEVLLLVRKEAAKVYKGKIKQLSNLASQTLAYPTGEWKEVPLPYANGQFEEVVSFTQGSIAYRLYVNGIPFYKPGHPIDTSVQHANWRDADFKLLEIEGGVDFGMGIDVGM